jgi:methylphosphotriester-DNA--protein-cysteine methyltransferase
VRLDDAELARTLLRLGEACEAPAGALERQSLLAAALERLGRIAGTMELEEPALPDATLAARVRQAMEIIESTPAGVTTLPVLATACGMEPYALHRAFTRLVGLPPHAYETHLRLRRAKALLRQGTSLIDAALGAGFCDQSHMHRHFTRLVGLTPAQYARAHALRG